ncbi:kinase-like domain-containing protein [Tricladium varicosporioides]|nr:kinase-like domain-containing protein [Hymenoscyphus varicosporioides]
MSNELATQGSTGHKDPVHNQQQNADQLQERLKDVRIECYYQLWTYFIPLNKQEELITTPVIENEIRREDVKGECQDPKACAIWTNEHAKQLFTILSYLGKGGSWIHRMYRDGVSDDDLPLVPEKQGNRVVRLRRKSDKGVIPTFDTWRDGDLEEFVRLQWWVLVPRFDMHNLKCQEFREETVLPLMEAKSKGALDEVIPQMKLAGFSTVTAYQIHSAHHNFWSLCSIPEDEQPRVAIKTLLDTDNEEEYEKERSILEKLGPYNHRHLIKLLSTYRLKKQYSFIFPCAQANLRNFWEMRKQPTFDKVTLLWSITQMYGLASALELIHNFKTTIDLKPPGGVLLDDNLKIKVKKGEEKFGRHGDIKPENILWFKEAWENEEARKSKEVDMMGILKITDLGLGRFHGRESRSNVDPKTVNATPTYEPPECKLEKPVSRAYDIWSMACLYLEFVTWLLEGPEAIHDFADARGQRREALLTIDDRIYTIVRDPIINDDNFFTILRDENNARSAVIREAVVEWVERLHTHRNCSKAIHELLDLTMNHLLRPYSDQRIDSSSLKIEMRNILEKAKFNPDYLEPRPHESLRLSPSAATSQNNPPRRSVRFDTWPTTHSPPRSPS